ncbi:MAG: hypothetical protein KKA78_07815, partial [Alphaproteobacteria bacterium]|nr:hypothetical protein [Alphaproteobacteria bacterium]
RLTSPFVVKPLAEGGSIGIDQRAFCPGWEEAARQVATLQEALACPVLIEEFLEGDEVSICLMGADGDSAQLAAVRLDVEGFDLARGIWSMEVKKTLTRPTENTPITHALDPALLRACRRLFDSFEKVDYMRIDGRMTRDGFRLIELTPDVHLGPTASFAQSMASLGVEYPDMWRTLISLAT